MTRDARLSALHRGDFRPGAALPSPALPPDPCSELLAPGHHAWRAVCSVLTINWPLPCAHDIGADLVSRASAARQAERNESQDQRDGSDSIARDPACRPLGPGCSLAHARSSRDTRVSDARRVRSRGSRIEPLAVVAFTMSNSAVLFVPAARCCARVRLFSFRVHPRRGVGGAPTGALCSVVAFARRDWSARVRRGASHDAGRSPLGAPPWRFSAGGRASISGIASGSVQRAPRSQVVVPGGRCPGPPEPAVTSRGRRTPLPAPPSGSSPEDAPP